MPIDRNALDDLKCDDFRYHCDFGWTVFVTDPNSGLLGALRCDDWTFIETLRRPGGLPKYMDCRLKIAWIREKSQQEREFANLKHLVDEYSRKRQHFQDACTNWLKTEEDARIASDLLAKTVAAEKLASEAAAKRHEQDVKRVIESTRRNTRYRLKDLIDVIDGCVKDHGYRVSWNERDVFASLDEDDRRLARQWMPRDVDSSKAEAIEARMLSARCAEKAAMLFYQGIGQQVVDVSATQLLGDTEDWKSHDILVERTKRIDVKNARSAVNCKEGYVEFCVPKFKEHRGTGVAIAGVFSPYARLVEIECGHPSLGSAVRKIVYLGETDVEKFRQLEATYSCEVVSIRIVREGARRAIPAWVFEYPNEFYRGRDQKRQQLRTCFADAELEELRSHRFDPIIPAYLSAGVPLPQAFDGALPEWQRAFFDRIQPSGGETLKMPNLFMGILKHFLFAARSGDFSKGFNPVQYKTMLYAGTDCGFVLPLGIYDPLHLIHGLIETVCRLWRLKKLSQNGLGVVMRRW